jgi:hypothetical protein
VICLAAGVLVSVSFLHLIPEWRLDIPICRFDGEYVPVLRSPESTVHTVEVINVCFGRTRFHQSQKLETFREVLEANLDFERLYWALGWETQG